MAIAFAFSGAVFMWAPVNTASTVHAETCVHEECEWVTIVKTTCSKPGKRVMICQDCEEILETEEIAKKEHKPRWEKTKDATCTADGVKSYVCRNCSEVIETEVIPAKGHKMVTIKSIAATCYSKKVIEKECKTCGFKTTEQTGDALNHSYKWKVTKKATCLGTGIKTGKCSKCSAVLTESTPPTGRHKYSGWTVKSTSVNSKKIKITLQRLCNVCKRVDKTATGETSFCSGKHGNSKYFYKFTKKSGRIVILCPSCHKSVTGRMSNGKISFSRPKKDNSKYTSKGWIKLENNSLLEFKRFA